MTEWLLAAGAVVSLALVAAIWLLARSERRAGRAEAEHEQERADAERLREIRTIEQRYRDADGARDRLREYADREPRR